MRSVLQYPLIFEVADPVANNRDWCDGCRRSPVASITRGVPDNAMDSQCALDAASSVVTPAESGFLPNLKCVSAQGAFLHRDWLTTYTTSMPRAVLSYVESHRNCEDIAMAFLV